MRKQKGYLLLGLALVLILAALVIALSFFWEAPSRAETASESGASGQILTDSAEPAEPSEHPQPSQDVAEPSGETVYETTEPPVQTEETANVFPQIPVEPTAVLPTVPRVPMDDVSED